MLNFRQSGSAGQTRGGGGYRAALFIFGLLASWAWGDGYRNLLINNIPFSVEVATTLPELIKGLSNRKRLEPDAGMLLMFPGTMKPCLWMKDTMIPLSAAFFDEGGAVVSVVDVMEPNTQTIHCSTRPASFAIEMNAGWFSQNGIGVGDQLDGWR